MEGTPEINSPEYWDMKWTQYNIQGLCRIDLPGFDLLVGHIKENDRVLDFGCGRGEWLNHISEVVPTARLYGSDISVVAGAQALKNVQTLTWTDDISIYENHFDVVTCLHTLEHFKDPFKCIQDLKKTLKPNGLMIVVLPWHDQVWEEHYKIWGKTEIEDLFSSFDCKIKLIVRNSTFLENNKIIFKAYDNGTLFQEVICFIRFNE